MSRTITNANRLTTQRDLIKQRNCGIKSTLSSMNTQQKNPAYENTHLFWTRQRYDNKHDTLR